MIDQARLTEIQPAFEVSYSNADIMALNVAIWRYLAILFAAVAILLWLVPLSLALMDGFTVVEAIQITNWAVLIVMPAVLIAFIVVVSFAKYWWSKARGKNGPISFAMTPDGISFRNPSMDGVFFWKAIRRIETRGQRLFVFLSARAVLILPRRSFGSYEQFEKFGEIARELWKQARHA